MDSKGFPRPSAALSPEIGFVSQNTTGLKLAEPLAQMQSKRPFHFESYIKIGFVSQKSLPT